MRCPTTHERAATRRSRPGSGTRSATRALCETALTHTSWLNEARPARRAATTSGSSSSATRCWRSSSATCSCAASPIAREGELSRDARGAGQRERAWRRRRRRSISASGSSSGGRGAQAGGRAQAVDPVERAGGADGRGLPRRRASTPRAAVADAAVRRGAARTSSSTRGSTTSRACRSARRRCWQATPVYEVVARGGARPRQAVRGGARRSRAASTGARSGVRRRRPSRARRRQALAALEREAPARVTGAGSPSTRSPRSPPTCWRSAAGCAAPGTRRTWSAAACATCCSAGRPADFDVATDARPEAVLELFGHDLRDPDRPQARHGHRADRTPRRARHVEVTTFRGEGAYLDGRRPSSVTYVTSLAEDLARRDFTMNAVALRSARRTRSPIRSTGAAISARRLIRAVGDPVARFREDGLRPMRAVRQAAQLEFDDRAADAGRDPARRWTCSARCRPSACATSC